MMRPSPKIDSTIFILLTATLSGVLCVGCGGSAVAPKESAQAISTMPQEVRDTLLDGVMDVLGHLDNYEEAAASSQVFDRLNQWSHGSPPLAGAANEWRQDPLVQSLPERFQSVIPAQSLGSSVFDAAGDVISLRDQAWLAGIVEVARGDAADDLAVAINLFRWTIRSLAISSDPPMVASATTPGSRWFLPGEILLAGRASPAQRAWIFLELLRQAGLNGVMLATGTAAQDNLRPWIPAVLVGGEAYLFEPSYGMPIPGAGGKGVATARVAASDPAVLARLSVADRPYPVGAADIAGLSVLVSADPASLSRRMHRLEAQMVGSRAIDLSVDASGLGAQALQSLPGENDSKRVQLWSFPWEVLAKRREEAAAVDAAIRRELAVMTIALAQTVGDAQQRQAARRILRPLYAARLREFRGDVAGPDGAKAAYLMARPSKSQIAMALKQLPPQQADPVERLYEQMKQDATYWLGMEMLAEGEYESAIDYLDRMTLQAVPDGIWTDAARINLAQALIGKGHTQQAIVCLRADPSPQRFGSRLLADQLEQSLSEKNPSPSP
ncbi:MAG: hypothetical protein WCI09_08845 [Planctomycetota bacterium]